MTKYGAVRTEYAGRVYASKAEARRAVELEASRLAGLIDSLEEQVAFPLVVQGVKVGTYVCDFQYREVATGRLVVEDVKGVKTAAYRIKKKLVRALYGVEIQEVAA